ncbi:MAG: hypothetical protein WA432_00490 [Candidatus Babeliaceae bacterium]
MKKSIVYALLCTFFVLHGGFTIIEEIPSLKAYALATIVNRKMLDDNSC